MSEPHPSPYYSNLGPNDSGPLRVVDCPRWLDVFGSPDAPGPAIGRAAPIARRTGPQGAIALFRLIVDGRPIPGLWECVGREFVPAAGPGAGG